MFGVNGIKLKQSQLEIAAIIEKELWAMLKKKFNIDTVGLNTKLVEGIRTAIKAAIRNNPTYISMLKNEPTELLPQLGLPTRIRLWAADQMLDLIADAVELGLEPTLSKRGEFGIGVEVLWTTDANQSLINRGEGRYVSSHSKNKDGLNENHEIPWLEWLLDGGSAYIANYHIELSDEYQRGSRTGFALMKKGGSWTFPSQYDNTPTKNFITESIEAAIPIIETLILRELG